MPSPASIINREKAEERRKEKLKKDQTTIENVAFGIYSGNKGDIASNSGKSKELVYRIPTETGSYRVVREQVDGSTTRGDLLNLRLRKKSDKYC